jgi:Protein tyrosine and serine/threonine kinase
MYVHKLVLLELNTQVRYMAPEVYKCEGYTEAVDVYAWAHLVAEMLTLERPYDSYRSAFCAHRALLCLTIDCCLHAQCSVSAVVLSCESLSKQHTLIDDSKVVYAFSVEHSNVLHTILAHLTMNTCFSKHLCRCVSTQHCERAKSRADRM